MRSDRTLTGKALPVGRAETMLFVDNGVGQMLKDEGLLDDGVRTDNDGDKAIGHALTEGRLRELCRLLISHAGGKYAALVPCDEPDRDRVVAEIGDKGGEMLFCQYLGRAKIGRLQIGVCDQVARCRGYSGFPAPHVALEESEHWMSLFEVSDDSLDSSRLRTGSREREGRNKVRKCGTVYGDRQRALGESLLSTPREGELKRKYLLEGEALLRYCRILLALW